MNADKEGMEICMNDKDRLSVLNKFIKAEKNLLHREFVAPVLTGGKIRVQAEGMVMECSNRSSFSGWGIFRVEHPYVARFVRQAEIWEKDEYRLRLSTVSLFLLARDSGGVWWAVHRKSNTFVPVYLAENMMKFDLVLTVFDGANHWFIEEHQENDPVKTRSMRECLQRGENADSLKIPGMKPFDHEMYRISSLVEENEKEKTVGRRIERALTMGGAALMSFAETDSGILVNWRKMGRDISTMVNRELSVISAGYCLSGEDRYQDLASLASLTGRQW